MDGWLVDKGGDVLLGVLGVRDSWCSWGDESLGGSCWRVGVPTFSLNLGVSSLYTFSHENILDYSTVLWPSTAFYVLLYPSISFYSLLLAYVLEHSTSFCNLLLCSIRFYHFPRCSVGFYGIPWDSEMFFNLLYASITFHRVPSLFSLTLDFHYLILSYLILSYLISPLSLSYLISLIFHSLPGCGDWIL